MIKKWLSTLTGVSLSFALFISGMPASQAHPGRTDANGGHTCRTNCEKWGLEYGEYHYHNGKSSTNSSSASSSSSNNNVGAKANSKKSEKVKVIKPAPIAIGLYVDKEKIALKSSAVLYDGQLMLPLTEMLQILKVSYKVVDGKVFIEGHEGQLGVPVKQGGKRMTKAGEEVLLHTPIIQYEGRVMVPLQLLRMAAEHSFEYKKAEKALYIALS